MHYEQLRDLDVRDVVDEFFFPHDSHLILTENSRTSRPLYIYRHNCVSNSRFKARCYDVPGSLTNDSEMLQQFLPRDANNAV